MRKPTGSDLKIDEQGKLTAHGMGNKEDLNGNVVVCNPTNTIDITVLSVVKVLRAALRDMETYYKGNLHTLHVVHLDRSDSLDLLERSNQMLLMYARSGYFSLQESGQSTLELETEIRGALRQQLPVLEALMNVLHTQTPFDD